MAEGLLLTRRKSAGAPGLEPLAAGPGLVSSGDDEVTVWAVWLEVTPDQQRRYASLLSPDESARAARFRFQRDSARFVVSHGVVRALLASALAATPESLRFRCGPCGKPELAGPFQDCGLHFNLAHSGDLALVAITRIGPVGVDIEQVRPIADMDEMVGRFFSPAEAAGFSKLPAPEKSEAFFNLWTRKEALLKATGQGIGECLGQVEVTFAPGTPAAIVSLPVEFGPPESWVLRHLRPCTGAVGAVAIHQGDYTS